MCPKVMFLGSSIQELSSICSFSCVPKDTPVVSKVDFDTYILTHVTGPLVVECRFGENKTIQGLGKGRPGALRIKIACDCKLIVNNEILVFDNYPCSKDVSESTAIHIIVPASWSRLKSLKVPAMNAFSSGSFETMDECLDERWPMVVPHWNLSYAVTHRGMREPPVIIRQREDSWPLVLYCIHAMYFALVTIIVIRNPHLLGFYVNTVVVSAEPIDIYMNETTKWEITYSVVFICVFVLGWILLRQLCRHLKRRKGSDDVAMTTCQGKDTRDDHLPRNLSLVKVDGKELRISLEWWDPSEGQ